MTVKDKQAQTRKLTEELNVSCYKIVINSFMFMYAVFVIIKMRSGNYTLQTTLEIIKSACVAFTIASGKTSLKKKQLLDK